MFDSVKNTKHIIHTTVNTSSTSNPFLTNPMSRENISFPALQKCGTLPGPLFGKNTKIWKKYNKCRQKGRAKRAPLLLRQFCCTFSFFFAFFPKHGPGSFPQVQWAAKAKSEVALPRDFLLRLGRLQLSLVMPIVLLNGATFFADGAASATFPYGREDAPLSRQLSL